MREAEAAAAPPDPALHERQVADLQAACRDSLSRIASLENEARCVPAAACCAFLPSMPSAAATCCSNARQRSRDLAVPCHHVLPSLCHRDIQVQPGAHICVALVLRSVVLLQLVLL